MPIYEYACSSCGKLNEVIQKVNDPAPGKCDGCEAGGTLSKVVSRTSFMLKGGGWYSDLYASSSGGGKKSGGGSSGGGTPPASSSSSGTGGSGTSAA